VERGLSPGKDVCMAQKKAEVVEQKGETTPVKKRRNTSSPVIGDNGYMLEPGDNTRYLTASMEVFNLPKVELTSVDVVQARIGEYFGIMAKYDMKPTVTGFAMALGLDRRRLWEIRTGNIDERNKKLLSIPSDVLDSIKKTYDLMEQMWENYMQNGKINPVAGIFLGKNNYGYKDQTEYVLTPNQKNEIDAESIRKRYVLEAPEDTPSDTPQNLPG
jgi:hypothetical protein